jgi:hypothetical protein
MIGAQSAMRRNASGQEGRQTTLARSPSCTLPRKAGSPYARGSSPSSRSKVVAPVTAGDPVQLRLLLPAEVSPQPICQYFGCGDPSPKPSPTTEMYCETACSISRPSLARGHLCRKSGEDRHPQQAHHEESAPAEARHLRHLSRRRPLSRVQELPLLWLLCEEGWDVRGV